MASSAIDCMQSILPAGLARSFQQNDALSTRFPLIQQKYIAPRKKSVPCFHDYSKMITFAIKQKLFT